MDYCGAAEFSIWHNGRLLSNILTYNIRPEPRFSEAISLPMMDSVRSWTLRLVWSGEAAADWLGFRAMLCDSVNCAVTPEVPGLLYARPWSIYSVTVMPSRDPHFAGAIALAMRVPGDAILN